MEKFLARGSKWIKKNSKNFLLYKSLIVHSMLNKNVSIFLHFVDNIGEIRNNVINFWYKYLTKNVNAFIWNTAAYCLISLGFKNYYVWIQRWCKSSSTLWYRTNGRPPSSLQIPSIEIHAYEMEMLWCDSTMSYHSFCYVGVCFK